MEKKSILPFPTTLFFVLFVVAFGLVHTLLPWNKDRRIILWECKGGCGSSSWGRIVATPSSATKQQARMNIVPKLSDSINSKDGADSMESVSADVSERIYAKKRQDYEPRCSNIKFNRNEIESNGQRRDGHHPYEAPEPFEYLHDCCDDCLPPVPESPDPLVSVTWETKSKKGSSIPLQIYRTFQPISITTIGDDDASVTINNDDDNGPRIVVRKNHKNNSNFDSPNNSTTTTIVMDWGSERAAWFELVSLDDDLIDNDWVTIQASISEFNAPYPGKTMPLTKYGNHTYRLETNKELYEGVRFTFLHFEFHASGELTIDDVSIVSKIKPIQYTSSFRSADTLLTKAWYWGAYGARLNVEQDQINSVLIERGDRVAIQGDGHPTIATILAVFFQDETKSLLKTVLNATDSSHKHVVDDSIMAYPLYWCLSAMNYYWTTYTFGTKIEDEDSFEDEVAFIEQLVDDIHVILDKRIGDFLDPNLDIGWFGWDDRVGNGWCFHHNQDACTREGLLSFAGLVIRVCMDFAILLESLATIPNQPRADEYQEMAKSYHTKQQSMTQLLRDVPEFPKGFGVHAAANAINSGVADTVEIRKQWMGTTDATNTLNNALTICSLSQFNQYWILQALGNIGTPQAMEHALESIRLCWGPMMELSTGGCFWELSSREWLKFRKEGDQMPHLPSYCHPWASGVTPWLSETLAGIRPLSPGYGRYVATPYVSARYPSVGATVATPHGDITVSASLQGTSFNANVDARVDGRFGLYKMVIVNATNEDDDGDHSTFQLAFLNPDTVKVNGMVVEPEFGELHYAYTRLESKNYSPPDQGGYFEVSADYIVPDPVKGDVFPTPHYPAEVLPLDRKRQGDGLKVYGKDGYGLLGCNFTARWPSYIHNVTIRQHGFPGWVVPKETFVGYSDEDPVYLPLLDDIDDGIYVPPAKNGEESKAKRVLGTIDIPNTKGGGQQDLSTIQIDVALEEDITPESLASTNNRKKSRILGSVGLEGTRGGAINSVLVDAKIAESTQTNDNGKTKPYYYLSIYFVAMHPENKHAIRVMDGTTYDLIAPSVMVDDYQGGVWWTLKTNRSVRLKIFDMLGIHLSAIAFAKDLPEVDGIGKEIDATIE